MSITHVQAINLAGVRSLLLAEVLKPFAEFVPVLIHPRTTVHSSHLSHHVTFWAADDATGESALR